MSPQPIKEPIIGKHRAPTRHHRRGLFVAIAVGAVASVMLATPAQADPVKPRWGEGIASMTARTCGSSVNWQAVAAAAGVRGPSFTVYYGRTYDVDCSRAHVHATERASRSVRTAAWVHPLPGAPLTSCYGWRASTRSNHQGLDMDGPMGAAVRAAGAGTVVSARWNGGYGREMIVDHGGGVWTQYAHLSAFVAGVGQRVDAGQTIARVGNSGHVISRTGDGSHLHFEVYVGRLKNRTNPAPWLRSHGLASRC